MKEYSLLVLKPDCVERNLIRFAERKVEEAGLEILVKRKMVLSERAAIILYSTCRNEDFFNGLLQFMLSGPIIAYIVKGDNARKILTEIVGFREPSRAQIGTIRSFGINIRYNLAHSSRTEEDFLREVSALFTDLELYDLGI